MLWRFLFALLNPLVADFVQIVGHDAPHHFASPEYIMADAAVWAFHCPDKPGVVRETDCV